jgi:hypothetical protein
MKYNHAADKYLEELYESVGAKTAKQKYNTLILKLEYQNDTINFSHSPSWEQKQTMMEYVLLEQMQLIELTYF